VNINQVNHIYLQTTFKHNTNLILSSLSPNNVLISNNTTLQTHVCIQGTTQRKPMGIKKNRQFASLTLLTISNITSYDHTTTAINVSTLLKLTFPVWINY